MSEDDRIGRDEPTGGAEPVEERPPDEPGRVRGPVFLLVAIIGAILIFAPIAWAFITIVAAGSQLTTATRTIFWVIWAIALIAFTWIMIAIWKRGA